jgi:hypothetical protein
MDGKGMNEGPSGEDWALGLEWLIPHIWIITFTLFSLPAFCALISWLKLCYAYAAVSAVASSIHPVHLFKSQCEDQSLRIVMSQIE